MPKLDLYKITRDLNYFKKGQKVWEYIPTGDFAALVIGRFRGNGRWVMGWIKIETAPDYEYGHKKPNAKWLGAVEVSDEFYAYYNKILGRITGYSHGT